MFSIKKIRCEACGEETKFGASNCAHCDQPFRYTPAHEKSERYFLHSWDAISYCLAAFWVLFAIIVVLSISNFINGVELIVVFLAPVSTLVFIAMLYGIRAFISDKFVEDGRVKTGEQDNNQD